MSLELINFLDELVTTNPTPVDFRSEGDDHIRTIKIALKNTFPGMSGRAWRSQIKSSNHTILATDNMTLMDCAAAMILKWPPVSSLGNGHIVFVYAQGGNVTIEANAPETVNGFATLLIKKDSVAIILCTTSGLVAFYTGDFTNPSFTTQVLSDGPVIPWDMDLGAIATVTLQGNRAMGVPTNLKNGTSILVVIQGAGGNHTLTFGASFKHSSGVQPFLSTAAGAKDILSYFSDGVNLHGGLAVRGAA